MKKLLEIITPKTLKNKLLIMFTSTVVIGMSVILAGFIFMLINLMKTEWASSLYEQANLIAINSQAAVEFGDIKEAERLVNTLAPNKAVLQASIIDLEEDDYFAKYVYEPGFVPSCISFPDEVLPYYFGEQCLRVQTYVPYMEDRYIVEFLVSLTPVQQAITETLIKIVLVFNLILLFFLVFINSLIRKLAKPVYKITNLVESFAQNPKLQDRILVKKEDEIAHLATNINQMMDSLQKRDKELEEHRDGLEKTILERTQDLATALFDAEAANRAKSDFLARMSHEIRTPMNGIVGLGKLMLKTNLDAQQKNYQEQVISSSEMLLSLINDILDYSKIEAGKLEIENIPFNLEQILRGVAGQLALRAQEKGLELLFGVAPNIPKNLKGDPLRLSQVLVNLANNAIKFTQEGEVVVEVVQKQDRLIFAVRDTGLGIPQDKLETLFSPFTQVDGSVTRRFGGTGLGLSISRQLVELMGGEIGVESEVGRGSCFHFSLPLEACESEANLVTLPQKYEYLKGIKILLVDDNASAREILSTMVESFGMRVEAASSGEEAIEMFSKSCMTSDPYRLVLLDWLMPNIDGIETARQISSSNYADKMPAILMITAGSYEKLQPQANSVGIGHILTKPVNESMLYDMILEALVSNQTLDVSLLEERQETKAQKQEIFDFTPISYAKILLVDDVELNRIVALAFLEEAGFTDVDIAVNGLDAVEKVQNNSYDLVLMDIQMPEMDGLTATKKIRENSNYSKLPILAMTAHAMAGDRELSLQSGLNYHLTKPIDPEILYKALLEWIPHKKVVENPVEASPGRGVEKQDKNPKQEQELPVIQGLDTEKGLTHTLGKPELYIKLLNSFNKEFGQNVAKAIKAQEEQDWATARRLAHSLKSGAATIGAMELSNLAKQAEESFAAETALTSSLIEELTQESERICQALSEKSTQLEKSPANSATQDIDLDTCIKLAQEMIKLLEADDAAALQSLQELENNCSATAELQEKLAEIRDLIEDIEYEDALEKTHDLISFLGVN